MNDNRSVYGVGDNKHTPHNAPLSVMMVEVVGNPLLSINIPTIGMKIMPHAVMRVNSLA